MRKFSLAFAGTLLAAGQLAAVMFTGGGTALAATTCSPAGDTGLTAAVVATSHQTISGPIDATGCDLGVYVGPGVTQVTISGATITGANDEGILVQDTSHVTIKNNTVTGNAVNGETFEETKAIEVVGSSNVMIVGNTVSNNGGGGIAIVDDGNFNPGGPNPGQLLPSTNNQVRNNTVTGNSNGCGIVLAAYNPGAGVSNNLVSGNYVSGNPAGIVVAADEENTTVQNNTVVGNTSVNNSYSGIIVHSNAPGDVVTNNQVVNNTVSGNMPYGILVAAGAPSAVLNHTVVTANQISQEMMGIGHFADTDTVIAGNKFSNVGTQVGEGH